LAHRFGHYARYLLLVISFALVGACTQPLTAGATPYAAYVMDARTGETLFAENADTQLHPASLTKMMTLYIAFQEIEKGNLSLDTMITVSANAASQPPSRLGLKSGQKIALRYLIRAAAVKSANDAAAAIGDAISGSPAGFGAKMTKTAKALGMKNTTFKNANGLTAKGHLSTAHDMSIMGRWLFFDFPQYYNIFSRRSTDAGIATVNNTNRRFLDAYKGADGIKTGYTDAAGFNLTASAERDGVRIIATVFGGKSTADRNAKMAKLLDLGFGKADKNVQTNVPPPLVIDGADDELLVSRIDESLPEVEGGAGKTVRVTMNPGTSLRPVARPDLEEVSAAADVVASLDPGIDAAVTEAIAPPAEPGTLQYQAAALASDEATATLASQSPAPSVSTLEYQVAALAEASDHATDTNTVDFAGIAAALAEAGVEISTETAAAEEPKVLSITATTTRQPVQLVASARPPKRNKPIYDSSAVKPAEQTPEAPVDEAVIAADAADPVVAEDSVKLASAETATEAVAPSVVVTRVSTSGGRQFGINVGRFGSTYDAERVLLQVQLRESATLAQGLRKVVKKSDGFEANFMGLTQVEASLACRKLTARQIECKTIGS
jgi:D-alanyl-D-alanine carboxypeptidase